MLAIFYILSDIIAISTYVFVLTYIHLYNEEIENVQKEISLEMSKHRHENGTTKYRSTAKNNTNTEVGTSNIIIITIITKFYNYNKNTFIITHSHCIHVYIKILIILL